MTIREGFAERFGEDQAEAIYQAAVAHKNGIHDKEGSDPFKWAISICIGYQCFEKELFRKHHGITAPFEEIKEWIRWCGDLGSHDGDFDFLAAFIGSYEEYITKPDAICFDCPAEKKKPLDVFMTSKTGLVLCQEHFEKRREVGRAKEKETV